MTISATVDALASKIAIGVVTAVTVGTGGMLLSANTANVRQDVEISQLKELGGEVKGLRTDLQLTRDLVMENNHTVADLAKEMDERNQKPRN